MTPSESIVPATPALHRSGLAIIEPGKYMVTESKETVEGLCEELALTGLRLFDLTRVVVPSGGATTNFNVREFDLTTPTQEIIGVITITHAKQKKWYRDPYGVGMQKGPPQCSSTDGVHGIGDRTLAGGQYPKDDPEVVHECETCAYNTFGTKRSTQSPGTKTRGKECTDFIRLIVFKRDSLVPIAVVIPPTSLVSFRQFCVGVMGKGLKLHEIETRISLSAPHGAQVATMMFRPMSVLPKTESDAFKKIQGDLAPFFAKDLRSAISMSDPSDVGEREVSAENVASKSTAESHTPEVMRTTPPAATTETAKISRSFPDTDHVADTGELDAAMKRTVDVGNEDSK